MLKHRFLRAAALRLALAALVAGLNTCFPRELIPPTPPPPSVLMLRGRSVG